MGRHALDSADVQAIRDLPGENYLIDLESASLDLGFHFRASEHWSGYAIATAISYGGGFMDSTIESFHDSFGFSTFGRAALAKNRVNVVYDLKSSQYTSIGPPSHGGIADPVIGVRYVTTLGESAWRLSAEAAAKVALSGRRAFLSTGRSDYGVQLALQHVAQRYAFYLNTSAVYYAGATFPVPQDSRIVTTVVSGIEYALTSRTNVILQGYASPSVYSRSETEMDELLKDKFQLTLGVRHRRLRSLWSFGVTENLQNLNNTPDIGFQLGFAYFPSRRPDSHGGAR